MDGTTSSGSEEDASIDVRTDLALWRQLSKINSALESQRDHHAAWGILTGLRDSTRRIIQIRARPKIRPLNILDLPTELLLLIFEYVRRRRHFRDYYKDGGLIKNIRLTCRRFCETSSHLLMHRIEVRLTRQSFARLDKVSRHPSISKGVRKIKLYLGPFYDPALAYDSRTFALSRAAELRLGLWDWECSLTRPLHILNLRNEIIQIAITKYTALMESFQEFAAEGIATNPETNLMILKLHKQYLQLYEDQANTLASLVQDVASAVGRMPTVKWVTVDDEERRCTNMHGRHRPKRFDDVEILQEYLLSPVYGQPLGEHQLSHPHLNLINNFLLSIQRLGVSLTGLDMVAPPPGPLPLTLATDIMPVKQLKAITFRLRQYYGMEYMLGRTPERWACYVRFMRSLLHTKSLEKIELNFWCLYYGPRPLHSIASILLSCSWPNLTLLHFEGPFHFEDLKAVVQPLRQEVNLTWNGYLMSGQWVDVLDFLRERKSPNQILGRDHRSICGQECESMSISQRSFIFDIRSCESLATRYIQGCGQSNPVRDWADGQLDELDELE